MDLESSDLRIVARRRRRRGTTAAQSLVLVALVGTTGIAGFVATGRGVRTAIVDGAQPRSAMTVSAQAGSLQVVEELAEWAKLATPQERVTRWVASEAAARLNVAAGRFHAGVPGERLAHASDELRTIQGAHYEGALALAEEIQGEPWRTGAFQQIGAEQVAHGHWDDAIETAKHLGLAEQRDDALQQVVEAQLRDGLLEAANATLPHFSTGEGFRHGLATIFTAKVRINGLESAVDDALALADRTHRNAALRGIAVAEGGSGHAASALSIVGKIQGEKASKFAMRALATAQGTAGHWDDALRTVLTDPGAFQVGHTLGQLAVNAAKAGHKDTAMRLADEVALPSSRNYWRDEVSTARNTPAATPEPGGLDGLEPVVRELGRQGKTTEALALAQTTTDLHERSWLKRSIAAGVAEAGNWGQAMEVALSIDSEIARRFAIEAIIKAQSAAGLWADAVATMRRWLTTGDDTAALTDIAVSQAKAAGESALGLEALRAAVADDFASGDWVDWLPEAGPDLMNWGAAMAEHFEALARLPQANTIELWRGMIEGADAVLPERMNVRLGRLLQERFQRKHSEGQETFNGLLENVSHSQLPWITARRSLRAMDTLDPRPSTRGLLIQGDDAPSHVAAVTGDWGPTKTKVAEATPTSVETLESSFPKGDVATVLLLHGLDRFSNPMIAELAQLMDNHARVLVLATVEDATRVDEILREPGRFGAFYAQ